MSKANAKRTDEQASDAQPTPQTGASADTGAATVVPSPPTDPAGPADEYQGQGGLYTLGADGRRVLIERTTTVAPATATPQE